MQNFRNLNIYTKAFELAKKVYALTESFPKSEVFGLTSQIRRSVISVFSNIAEGSARSSSKEFKNFISIAIGSLTEVEVQLEFASKLKYFVAEKFIELQMEIIELRKMLSKFKCVL